MPLVNRSVISKLSATVVYCVVLVRYSSTIFVVPSFSQQIGDALPDLLYALRLPHIRHLLETRPTWFAVRGAVCEANRRDGPVHVLKVRSLAGLLHWKPAATAGS